MSRTPIMMDIMDWLRSQQRPSTAYLPVGETRVWRIVAANQAVNVVITRT